MAGIYDWLLVLALMMVLSVPFVALTGEPVAAGSYWYQLALLAVAAAFFCGFWHQDGQTLGMRAWRLQLIGEHTQRVTWAQAARRFLWAWLSLAPAGAGFWWLLLDADQRSWHDRLSATRIVQLPPHAAKRQESGDST
jgi:uncharacterized RDD family membrane protein YckC